MFYSKDKQLKKTRLKPKPSMKNKPKISSQEKRYLSWLQTQNGNVKCFVCGTNNGIEFHHIKNKSTDKKNHKKLIPLCYEHHRTGTPSPHNTPKLFRDMFPIEEQEVVADKLFEEFLETK